VGLYFVFFSAFNSESRVSNAVGCWTIVAVSEVLAWLLFETRTVYINAFTSVVLSANRLVFSTVVILFIPFIDTGFYSFYN